jgi:hypothetical protein
MFRSHDHPQGAYIVPCQSYSLKTLNDLHRYVELVLWQHVCKQIYLFNRQSQQYSKNQLLHNSLSIPYSLIICAIINSYCIALTVY